ncbi:hypothetical protein [Spirosoma koreense]
MPRWFPGKRYRRYAIIRLGSTHPALSKAIRRRVVPLLQDGLKTGRITARRLRSCCRSSWRSSFCWGV